MGLGPIWGIRNVEQDQKHKDPIMDPRYHINHCERNPRGQTTLIKVLDPFLDPPFGGSCGPALEPFVAFLGSGPSPGSKPCLFHSYSLQSLLPRIAWLGPEVNEGMSELPQHHEAP